jgi:hypothetical protein
MGYSGLSKTRNQNLLYKLKRRFELLQLYKANNTLTETKTPYYR